MSLNCGFPNYFSRGIGKIVFGLPYFMQLTLREELCPRLWFPYYVSRAIGKIVKGFLSCTKKCIKKHKINE